MAIRHYFVYIIANARPTLYIGVTNNISRRSTEHKYKLLAGFTSQYNLTKLVYYEEYTDIKEAIKREKQLKEWKRSWKLDLIKKTNPEFQDLYDTLILGSKKRRSLLSQG